MNVRARAYYCDRPPVTKFLPFNILQFLASHSFATIEDGIDGIEKECTAEPPLLFQPSS